ncbi:hypothetical protein [Ekhidna sp.]|uniref:hypothetical protein n=1 Tax=Ekhidna sp. TaxID=2608089 RepID=UPI003298C56E
MIQLKIVLFQLLLIIACASSDTKTISQNRQADVTRVTASGSENNYSFSVTIASPDTGCDQYADWWEVVSEEGELIYRRILLHSHVNEQPFKRSGGSVTVAKDQTVWVRAHMNNTGYGGVVMKGTVEDGFKVADFPDTLGVNLDKVEPLPGDCNF